MALRVVVVSSLFVGPLQLWPDFAVVAAAANVAADCDEGFAERCADAC